MKYDVIIIGGGLAGCTAGVALQKAGLKCAIVSEGASLHKTPLPVFAMSGGAYFAGDTVISGEFSSQATASGEPDNAAAANGEVLSLTSVRTAKLEGTPLEARFFVLATGKFFSRGLEADMNTIRERVFDCDVRYDADPTQWCSPDFFGRQNFESYGVITDEDGRALKAGRPVENLFAIGGVTADHNDAAKAVQTIIELCRKTN